MALFDDEERAIMIGVGIGLGAATLAKGLWPVLGSVGRPFAKALIKGGLVAYEKGRESAAQLGETIEDLVAEARMEMDGEAPAPAPVPKRDNGQVN